MAVPLTGISSLTMRDRLVRRAFHTGRSKGKIQTTGNSAPKKQRTTVVPAPLATSQPTPLPTAHGGKAMEVDTQSGTSQPSGAPFPYPFTRTPSLSSAPSAPSQPEPPSVSAPPARPEDQQDNLTAEPTPKKIQDGAPQIPRSFCDEILTVLANLPDEWPLVKIDLILSKAETYYVSWRRFLYLNERLRTLDADPAARAISRNKGRILEHLVQVLNELIVASIEPAKEFTRTKKNLNTCFCTLKISGSALSGLICTRHSPLIASPVETERRLAWFVASAKTTTSKASTLMLSSS